MVPANMVPVQLQTFTRRFFQLLGSPCREVAPDLWQVRLTPEQKAVISPLPAVPWWAAPPPPPEPVTWELAFTPQAAAQHPQARLITGGSALFQQLLEVCRQRGLAVWATLEKPGAWGYKPHLWLHLRLIRRGLGIQQDLETWSVDLTTGHAACLETPPIERLRPGPPAGNAHIERIRLTPREAWEALKAAVVARQAERDASWARAAREAVDQEVAEIRSYYQSLLREARDGEGEALLQERERRIQEARGRHRPRIQVVPLAAALVYCPL